MAIFKDLLIYHNIMDDKLLLIIETKFHHLYIILHVKMMKLLRKRSVYFSARINLIPRIGDSNHE